MNLNLVYGFEFVKDDGNSNDSQRLIREYGQRKHNLLVFFCFL